MSQETVKFELTAEDRTAQAFAAVKRALSGLEQAGKGLNKIFAAGFLGVSAVGVGALGMKAIESAGSIGELAEQMGVSAESLQVYQAAALQTGTRIEQLDSGIAKFSQTVGRAARGEKDAADAFKNLGVGVLTASGQIRPVEAVLANVADAIAAIPDPSARAAAAADLFGRSGQKLLPMLSGGSAGLSKFAADAHRAGMVLDQSVVESSDRAADAIARLRHESERSGQRLAAFAAPALEFFANYLSVSNRAGRKSIAEDIAEAESSLASLSTKSNSMAREQAAAIRERRDALKSIQALQGRNAARDGEWSPTATFTPRSAEETKRIDDTVAALNRELEAFHLTGDARARAEALAKANIQPEDAEAQVIGQLAEKLYLESRARQAAKDKFAVRNSLDIEIEQNGRLIEALKESSRAYETEAAFIEIENRHRATGIPLMYEEEAIARKQAETLGQQRDRMKELKDQWDDNRAAARDVFHVIGTGLEDAAVKGGKVSDMLKGLEQDLIRIAWRYTVTKPLESAFGKMVSGGGGIGDIFGQLFGSGPDPADGAIGGVFDGARAAGGPVSAGGAYLVGEDGPEIFNPGSSGSIVSNDNIGRAGGQPISIVYNIDARGADAAAISNLRGEIRASERRTLSAVAGLANRGGQFAKAVGRRK